MYSLLRVPLSVCVFWSSIIQLIAMAYIDFSLSGVYWGQIKSIYATLNFFAEDSCAPVWFWMSLHHFNSSRITSPYPFAY